jgi:uncharacterized lipoprotein YddW (UPF0748 family)
MRLRAILPVALVVFLRGLPGVAAAEDVTTYRSIFVDRFGDYPYDGNIPSMVAEINQMMQDAADEGFTEIIWQVRGRGEAIYNSQIEPRQSAEDSNGPVTPGFDPLQTAIDAAHSRGLKLHAWINATPLWRTSVTPPPGHMFHNTGPSFRLMDINGVLEPPAGWSNYSSVNPVLPEVHAHINNVVNELATAYDVDGIHLDYIRYVPGALNFDRLPHDPIAHQMFFDHTLATGGVGLDGANPANFAAYKNYVKGRITDLVRSIKSTVDAAEVSEGRVMELTASVWRDPDVGENDYIQDYRTWLEEDLLDVAMPMIYLSQLNDATYFNANLLNSLNIPTNARVAPTVASYLHLNPTRGGGVALTLGEIQRAYEFGAGGVGFYDYPNFFNGYTDAERERIRDFFAEPEAPGVVIDNFDTDEDHFRWEFNHSPPSQTFGLAGGAGGTTIERVTTDAQSGIGSQLLNLVASGAAAWQLRHNSGIGTAASPGSNVPLEASGYVGFWLKTDDPGVSVRIAIDDPVNGNTAIEHGYAQDVIADNEWHLYQWNFVDDARWNAFNTAGGANGDIDAWPTGANVTIDSIFFSGTGNAQIYLDTVSHNFNGLLAAAPRVPGDYNGDGTVSAADYGAWRVTFGESVAPGIGADGNGNGLVDVADFVVWRKQFAAAAAASSQGAAVPEPHSAALAIMLLLMPRRRKRNRRPFFSRGDAQQMPQTGKKPPEQPMPVLE